ncbi:hypothetical protein Amet_2335 [Alkaliphilus metalliredigens QYMF]|uniref:Uncharacterized protein n=1 Tax=Alkaliphilus metalliredigens (strain QYMF) TaxID=293826 RepID=A6TQM1_ALKMQ|nr:hypothetical protein [Alkaliphilus metalliredigens]ABR48489.1 hypothetical protein Amet_2335 [Alkaliphilus metalliredigens QYMF]
MNKYKKFNIIKGGKEYVKYQFVSAMVTQTRLMGVMAVKIHWKITDEKTQLIQWFLLDSEEHGIYDYKSMKTNKPSEYDYYTEQFMANLGGKRNNITKSEAIHLVSCFMKENKKYNKPLPDPLEEYKFIGEYFQIFIQNQPSLLKDKIFEKIYSSMALLNYFMMRATGKDIEGMNHLIADHNIFLPVDFEIASEASQLLKNTIQFIEKNEMSLIYSMTSIIDTCEGYKEIVSRIKIKRIEREWRVLEASIIKEKTFSPEEVKIEIQKIEYIKIFTGIENSEKLINKLLENKRSLLEYEFIQGRMFVEYYPNNKHVEKDIYYLSGDLRAIYFVNQRSQLIVCYYNAAEEDELQDFVLGQISSENAQVSKKYEINESVIYQYAEGEMTDFIEFIGQFQSKV